MAGTGHRKGGHHPGNLARGVEGLPAGRKHPQAGAGIEKCVHQSGHGLNEVLAVVHHKEHLPRAQGVLQRLEEWAAWLLAHPQNLGHRLRHQICLRERGEIHQVRPLRVGPHEVPGHLERQARLSTAARSREGKESRHGQQTLYLQRLDLAPYEAGTRNGQVVHPGGSRARGRSIFFGR